MIRHAGAGINNVCMDRPSDYVRALRLTLGSRYSGHAAIYFMRSRGTVVRG